MRYGADVILYLGSMVGGKALLLYYSVRFVTLNNIYIYNNIIYISLESVDEPSIV